MPLMSPSSPQVTQLVLARWQLQSKRGQGLNVDDFVALIDDNQLASQYAGVAEREVLDADLKFEAAMFVLQLQFIDAACRVQNILRGEFEIFREDVFTVRPAGNLISWAGDYGRSRCY